MKWRLKKIEKTWFASKITEIIALWFILLEIEHIAKKNIYYLLHIVEHLYIIVVWFSN